MAEPTAPAAAAEDPIVQYILLRKDLKWPVGALVSQGAHACVAACVGNLTHTDTQAYLADMDNMHKVTLAAPSAEDLDSTATALKEAGIEHKLWVEQPEGIHTCVATRPVRKSVAGPIFAKYKLFR